MQKTLLVIDNFLNDPQKLRKEAAQLRYGISEINFSNLVSTRSKYANAIFRRLSKFEKKRVTWDKEAGTFRKQRQDLVHKTKNAFFAHSDGVHDFVSLLYLSPPEECHGGTAFYTHKETGLAGFQDFNDVNDVMARLRINFDELVQITDRDARNPSKWIQTDMIQMKYNRMILYNGRRFHSHVFDFKKIKKKDSERLTFLSYGFT